MNATEALILILVLDNDRTLYKRCWDRAWHNRYRSQPGTADTFGEVKDGTWTPEQSEVFHLAEDLQDRITELVESATINPMSGLGYVNGTRLIISAMIQHALDHVDWHVVARHYLSKVREQETHHGQ